MKKSIFLLSCVSFLLLNCKSSSTNEPIKSVTLSFESKNSSGVTGTAVFIEKNGVVSFTANIKGLKPGEHAIHIHEKADCSANDGSSAGGHWNPTYKNHGKWGGGDYHKGDIGNFTANKNGNGSISLTTDEWCIDCDDNTKNIIGKSLIVHDKPDDFISQPSGNAGARVACSAIIQ